MSGVGRQVPLAPTPDTIFPTTLVMAKQFAGMAKFQIPGGQATPAPPVGTSLGKYGINLGQFVQQFNERTKEAGGMMIPVVVTVYNDRSFEFITKSPPAAVLLKKADEHCRALRRCQIRKSGDP